MKNLTILFMGLSLVCSALAPITAQNLYVMEHSGQQTSYVINDIGKLHFSTGELIVEMQGGTSEYYPLAEIRYLNFTDLVQVNENVPPENTDISLYPNPAEGILHVDCCLPDAETVTLEIISPEGRLICRETTRNAKGKLSWQVDVSAVPQGLYVCRLRSEKTVITKKFIKN